MLLVKLLIFYMKLSNNIKIYKRSILHNILSYVLSHMYYHMYYHKSRVTKLRQMYCTNKTQG